MYELNKEEMDKVMDCIHNVLLNIEQTRIEIEHFNNMKLSEKVMSHLAGIRIDTHTLAQTKNLLRSARLFLKSCKVKEEK